MDPRSTQRHLRRTWPQRLVLVASVLVALGCLGAAGLVWYGNNRLGALERVVIDHSEAASIEVLPVADPVATPGPTVTTPSTTELVIEPGDVPPQNFLLVGSDGRGCIDPDSPYAGAFLGEGSEIGQRSDTIMVLRVDPDASQAAILAFPRDLWVKIAGTGRRSRINSAFDPSNPSRLVQTIEQNFGIPIDHYVEVDFCAFKGIVDAVGGVKVPFAYPVRDRNTGLDVPQAGCVAFTGESALAYVRSRKFEWFDGKQWRQDGTSDYGRISRQQDFIRRSLQRAVDRGARSPAVAKDLLDAALQNVRVDQDLTVNDMLRLATKLREFDPGRVRTFRVDGKGVVVGGAAVIRPDLTSSRAVAILDVFRGKARLGEVETIPAEPDATSSTTTAAPTAPGASTTQPTAPLPTVAVEERPDGILPANDPACR